MVITHAAVKAALRLLPPSSFIPRYVAHVARRSESHLGYQALAALAAVTQTAPIGLSLSYGTDLFANELFLLVGPSGLGRKGTAVQTVARILSDGDSGITGALPAALAHGDIASEEGMQDHVAKQPRFLIAFEEYGQFLQKTSTPQKAGLRLIFNSLFDCASTAFGRIRASGRGGQRQEAGARKTPRGSAIAATTPDYLKDYTRRTDWTGGFMSRWFTIYPEDFRRFEPPPQPDLTELEGLINLLRTMAALHKDEHARLRCAGRTPAAEAVWRQWITSSREIVAALKDDAAKAVLQRLEAHALKIALILAWNNGEARADGWLMSTQALVPAIRLANLHAASITRIAQEIPANDEAAERRRVYETIAPEPGRTSRAVILQTVGISAKRLEAHVKTLMQAQLIDGFGDDVEGSVSFSRRAAPRVDAFDGLGLWEPGADLVDAERNTIDGSALNALVNAAIAQTIIDPELVI